MNEERLQEIKDSIDLQRETLIALNMQTLCVDEEMELYNEIIRLKKQKDDVVELIIKLYQKEYNKTSDWWLQEELCNNFDEMNIFTNFELERMLGEIDVED